MPRAKAADVEALLAQNWDGFPAYGNLTPTSVQPFIDVAYEFLNQAIPFQIQRGFTFGSAMLEKQEQALACYFYCKSDPMYEMRSTERAHGKFIVDKDTPEQYAKMAMDLDPSRTIAAFLKGNVVSASWGGRNANAQTPIEDR